MNPAIPTSQKPTRVRNVVMAFAVTLAIITYVDRVCISQAAPEMQKELGLTKEQMGWAFTAFGLAYALFEIPGGWLGDRIGPRKVLMRVVSMWSIFTIATGWAWNLASLVTFRFLFGAGEAGCFPNVTKAFTLWFPQRERVRAQGFMWLSARWGGAFTPLLVGWMLAGAHEGAGLGLHYRWVFLIFGILGIAWAILFFGWFRDHPKDHPQVNAAELEIIGDTSSATGGHSVPWSKFIGSLSVWMLWLQYFCMSFAWYFYITWMPTFIMETFPSFSPIQRALLGCVPLFFGGLGSMFAGLLSGPLDRHFLSTARARRFMGCVGLGGAAVMLLLSVFLRQAAAPGASTWLPILSMLAVGMASFSNDLAMPGAWGACMDVGGKYTGSLAGSMNMMGNLGGALPGVVIPLILNLTNPPGVATPNWNYVFYLFAAVYLVGAISWRFIDPVTPLEDTQKTPA